jgi:hypothetical protein
MWRSPRCSSYRTVWQHVPRPGSDRAVDARCDVPLRAQHSDARFRVRANRVEPLEHFAQASHGDNREQPKTDKAAMRY